MAVQRLHTNKRMSQIVVHGDTVYLAGQVALNNKGAPVAAQAGEILQTIESYLAEAGSDKNHMLSASVWLSDIKYFSEFNQVWDAWLPEGQAPARACVESKLVMPGWDVEVSVIAAVRG